MYMKDQFYLESKIFLRKLAISMKLCMQALNSHTLNFAHRLHHTLSINLAMSHKIKNDSHKVLLILYRRLALKMEDHCL